MFKELDKYIAKKFITTFLVTILLFTIIIIVFDIAEKLDDFLEHKAPIKNIIFVYYTAFIPSLINTFSPIFIFIAVLYFTSRLASRSEFISMLAGGMSLKRILLPYMVVSAVLAYGSYLLNARLQKVFAGGGFTQFTHPPENTEYRSDGNIHVDIAATVKRIKEANIF